MTCHFISCYCKHDAYAHPSAVPTAQGAPKIPVPTHQATEPHPKSVYIDPIQSAVALPHSLDFTLFLAKEIVSVLESKVTCSSTFRQQCISYL